MKKENEKLKTEMSRSLNRVGYCFTKPLMWLSKGNYNKAGEWKTKSLQAGSKASRLHTEIKILEEEVGYKV